MQQLTESSSSFQRSRNSLPWLAAAGLSAAGLAALAKWMSGIRRPTVELRGKIALISGGSRGLGLAIAQEFGKQGCKIGLCARDQAELDQAAKQLEQMNIETAVFVCDLTKETEITSLVERVVEHFGRIDILVNNAGEIKVAPFEKVSHDDFEEAMNLMFWGPVNLTLAAIPHMRKQGGGHIVNITSVGGRVAIPHLLPYSCAKFAFVGFSTGLSSELDPNHLHVLTVVPGLMRTGSYLNAKFKGSANQEFGWFSILGNLPGLSVAARDAARSIRDALASRQLTCTISFPAKLLIQSEAILPEATRAAMQILNQVILPKASKTTRELTGKAANSRFGGLFQAVTLLGKDAAQAFNE